MTIIQTRMCLCPCCMEEHDVQTVSFPDSLTFKGVRVDYETLSEYCEKADEYYTTEAELAENDLRMKNAYRKKLGLLTSEEIVKIRTRYDISQTDLCTVLGWGGKTVTRYEGHQIQDAAHDAILRKISDDPAWFLELLKGSRTQFSEDSYRKYQKTATDLYQDAADSYLRKNITAQYAQFAERPDLSGNTELQFEKIVDAIRYFAASKDVCDLYKGKLSKLLWLADTLSFQESGYSVTGLLYCNLPVGPVPVAFDFILELRGICKHEVEFEEGTGVQFVSDERNEYPALTEKEKTLLGRIAQAYGRLTKAAILDVIRNHPAVAQSKPQEAIMYRNL